MWRQFISFLLIVNTAQSIKFDPTTGRFKNIIVQLSDHLNPSECDTILANIQVINCNLFRCNLKNDKSYNKCFTSQKLILKFKTE